MSDAAADDPQDALDLIAAEWVVRLGGAPLTAHEKRRLQQWLGASDNNRRAFELAQQTWGTLADVRIPDVSRRRRWRVPAAVAASFLLAAIGLTVYRTDPWTSLRADHDSAVGEIRRITLEDGSVATLDTNSAIAVAYGESARSIRLLKGTALFDVASVPNASQRPFTVEAAHGTVKALGTSFIVSSAGNSATVRVIRHSVLITPPGGNAGARVIGEGQQVRYDSAGSVLPSLSTQAATASLARGNLIFDRAPVRDALREINRYRNAPIVTLGEDLDARTISGVFRIEKLDDAAQLIATELGANTVAIPSIATVIY